MRRLSLILSLLVVGFIVFSISETNTDSPHGANLKYSCDECHSTNGWKLDSAHSFNHATTGFKLKGEHSTTKCSECHATLVFEDVKSRCYECHTDVHEQTLGTDCEKCHSSNSWIVSNMNDLHMLTRFPLLGSHASADCEECHKSTSELHFPPISSECVSCHLADYNATTTPNHLTSGFSTDCESCHSVSYFEWSSKGFIHAFFPLTLGHNINECSRCHADNNYANTSSECISCNQDDYNSSTNPNHALSNFPTNCLQCHTTNPGWKPSTFDHSSYFPIYSGRHAGEWNNCTDCHTNVSNYAAFSCTDCHAHNQSSMDDEHDDVNNYSFQSSACLNCHPRGEADDKK